MNEPFNLIKAKNPSGLWLVITGEPYDENNYVVKASSKEEAINFIRTSGDQRELLSSSKLDYKGPIIISIHTGG